MKQLETTIPVTQATMPVFGMLLMGDKKFRMKPMPNLLKKLLFSFLSGLILFTSVLPYFSVVKAQDQNSTWYNSGPLDWYIKVYDEETSPASEIFGERYTAAQVQWVLWSVLTTPINLLSNFNKGATFCVLKKVAQNVIDIGDCASGAWEAVSGLFSSVLPNLPSLQLKINETKPLALIFDTSNRQISGIKYINEKLNKFALVSEVNAQEGFGYRTALILVRDFWTGSRNIAYALVVIVVIAFAFMIMFRVKINPQTVISVQSALPKVFGAVILATFSYAIAGLIVDLMYVVMGLFATLVKVANLSSSIQTAYSFISGDLFSLGGLLGNFGILVYMLLYWIIFAFAIIASLITTFGGLSVFGMLASVVMILVWVWVLVLAIWYTIKIPYVLIKTLINVYLSVIVAPIQIVLGSIVPSIGFTQWLKNLIANLLVFPVTGLFLYLAWVLLLQSFPANWSVFKNNSFSLFGILPIEGSYWGPPWLGSGKDMSGLLFVLMSFGVLIAVPKVIDIIKAMIMGERFSYGTAVGEALGAAKIGASGALAVSGELDKSKYPWPLSKVLKGTPPEKLSDFASWLNQTLKNYSNLTKGHF